MNASSTTNKPVVFSYLRVSSVGQVDKDGFDRQRDAVAKWAKSNQSRVAAEYREEGVSGTKESIARPAMSAMLIDIGDYLLKDIPVTVVVEKADRFARDLIVSEMLLAQFREMGIQVIEAEGGNDLTAGTDNPTATLIRQVLAAFAEFEKTSLVLKLRAARERVKRETGRCGGRHPFGHYPGEQAAIDKMLALRKEALSFREIAAELNRVNDLREVGTNHQYPSRGGKEWTHGSVARIIKDATTTRRKKAKA